MSDNPLITDEELSAYLDGELTAKQHQSLERRLQQDPDAQERLARLQQLNTDLKKLYEPILDEPIPERLMPKQRPTPRKNTAWWQPRTATVAALLLGASLGWFGSQFSYSSLISVNGDLVEPAAFAHVVYSPEVRHPVEVTADQQEHLFVWLSNRMHSDIKAPDLSESGYRLLGGRLLPSSNRMAAQFMYEDSQGRRVTLYARRGSWNAIEPEYRYLADRDVNLFYWVEGEFGYAMVSQLPKDTLSDISYSAYQKMI